MNKTQRTSITYHLETEKLIQKKIKEGKYRSRSHALESAFLEVNDKKETEV